MTIPGRGPLVVAFGGNVLLPDTTAAPAQEERATQLAHALLTLLDDDISLVLVHGNGPQVGTALLRVEETRGELPDVPLDVLVAETQASIGYLLAQAIHESSSGVEVAVMITRVVVDPHDEAFRHPTKPIGRHYGAGEAELLQEERGWKMTEVGEGRWRRVVPSPHPLEVIELSAIHHAALAEGVVIAGGGGGIPVVRENGRLRGVEAVIDKDRTAGLVATRLEAAALLIVTGEPYVIRGYGTDHEERITHLNVAEARGLLASGELPAGSMGPKVEAAADFVRSTGHPTIITDTEHLLPAWKGEAGTHVHR